MVKRRVSKYEVILDRLWKSEMIHVIPTVELCIEARVVTAPVRRLKWSNKHGRYRKYKMNDRTKRWNLVKEGES